MICVGVADRLDVCEFWLSEAIKVEMPSSIFVRQYRDLCTYNKGAGPSFAYQHNWCFSIDIVDCTNAVLCPVFSNLSSLSLTVEEDLVVVTQVNHIVFEGGLQYDAFV